ncbi:peptidoglycan recognition protein [Streptomyces sp. NPDC006184]|uniref:peptidoglycan recognition protein family protein n=1 Tax=Streptomyces sp. NPDC006184 TaxID=3155455 RepID=UPI0033B319B2
MRGLLTSPSGVSPLAVRSIGLTCAAVVALAPAPPATAVSGRIPGAAGAGGLTGAAIPGSTRSLPLVPLTRERVHGTAPQQGLYRAHLGRFALAGVVWDDPDTALRGRVQVRTRSVATGKWSGWQDVEAHNADHGADPGTAERSARSVRGATAPLWVGDSDGVDVRVSAGSSGTGGAPGGRAGASRSVLLPGLRLELVDPGKEKGGPGNPGEPLPGSPRTAPGTEVAPPASAAGTGITRSGATAISELDRRDTERELTRLKGPTRAKPYVGPRPRIVTRRGWGADESLRRRGSVYTKKVKAAFVHHTASGNRYTCAQAPAVVRGIYRYHVRSMGWRDIGYNFLVDKCGTLYEGRTGGVAKAVLGAHTLGFNSDSMGIAVIGSYGASRPSSAAVKAVARLTAWKLGLYGGNPRGKTSLTSGGGNRYPRGRTVRLHVISGHRDGFATECPGKRLYGKLGTARSSAARYQGR